MNVMQRQDMQQFVGGTPFPSFRERIDLCFNIGVRREYSLWFPFNGRQGSKLRLFSKSATPTGFLPVVPLVYMDDWKQGKQIAAWLDETPLRKDYPTLMLSHPAIFYFMDAANAPKANGVEWLQSTLKAKPPGTLMVWDPIYGVFNSDAQRSIKLEEIEAAGWLPKEMPPEIEGDWRIFVSPQPAPAAP